MRVVQRVDGASIRAANAMATLLVAQEHNSEGSTIYQSLMAN